MLKMAGTEVIKRIEQRATAAEQLITVLKRQIEEIRLTDSGSASAGEMHRLKKENFSLRNEIENWKKKLIAAEMAKGMRQIPFVQVRHCSTKAVPSEPQKPVEVKKETEAEKKQPQEDTKKEKKKPNPKPAVQEAPADVGRLDMRVGRIITAKKHPDADSLYVETIDVGEAEPRTVISGLVKFIPEDQMQNRMAVILCNLKPSKMRGIMSHAMVMCASTPDKVEILSPPEGSKPGDLVNVEGFERQPDAQLNPKKKIFEACVPDLKTNSAGLACYKNVPWTVNGKPCVSQTLKEVQIK